MGRELWIALETATFKLHYLVVLRIGEKEIERHLFVLLARHVGLQALVFVALGDVRYPIDRCHVLRRKLDLDGAWRRSRLACTGRSTHPPRHLLHHRRERLELLLVDTRLRKQSSTLLRRHLL